ncbi:MAG: RNHCP domain-containing protein [bacterium]
MPKKFTRKKEDFTCEKCGAEITGNGYTNHCPKCLWSKHVDVHPGDRLDECGGLMRPIDVTYEKGEYILIHRCEKCGALRRKKVESYDDFDKVIEITKKVNDKKFKGR